MKRNVITIIMLMLVFTFTTAAGAETIEAAGLTLINAQKQAEINSRQAVIDDLDIKIKESAWIRAKDDAAMAGSAFGPESIITKRIRQEVKPTEAETAYEVTKMTKKEHSMQLKLDVKKLFLNILLAQKELEIESKKLEFAKERMNMAEARYAINSITRQEMETAQNDVFSKTIDVEAIAENLEILDIKLKDQMSLPLDGDVLVMRGVIELERFPEVDIEKVASTDKERDILVYSAAGKYNAAKRTLELTEGLFKPGNETYDGYEIELEKALRDYEAAKRNREITVRNMYNDLLNLKDSMELADKYEELLFKKLDNAKIKSSKGQMSKDAYITSEEQYLDAVYRRCKAICDFNIKKDEFLNMTRIE